MHYFISDVHLGVQKRELDVKREDLLLAFLQKIQTDCDTLFIIGDLFDYWFEYKTVIPKYFYRTLTMLKSMREKCINIVYLIGNHDFGHADFFEKELDIKIFKDDTSYTIHGKKFYLSHGDGKSHNDTGYRILKSILRNPVSLKLFLLIHPDFGIRLASSSSRNSRKYTDNKHYGKTEGMEEFAAKKIAEGYDYVIMGHRHKPINQKIGNGFYINTGDWMKSYTYGIFDGNEFSVLSVNDFLREKRYYDDDSESAPPEVFYE